MLALGIVRRLGQRLKVLDLNALWVSKARIIPSAILVIDLDLPRPQNHASFSRQRIPDMSRYGLLYRLLFHAVQLNVCNSALFYVTFDVEFPGQWTIIPAP